MKNYVRFLNHSCIELVAPNTIISCDPWFRGTAFTDGWSLLNDKSHNINKLSFDYIWISHEHPDHFSIPTLSTLHNPVKFLFQETKDRKVASFLENKGHAVIELSNKKPTQIGDLELTCVICDGYDSSLIVKFPNGRVLVNMNDARVDVNNHINTELKPSLEGCDVDLLSFQFGYANWAGNKGDKKIPEHQQELIDKKNKYAIKEFNPKMIMPFASFIYFSHEENFYWNEKYWLDHIFSKFSKLTSQLIFPSVNQKISLDGITDDELNKSNELAKIFWESKLKNIKPLMRSKFVPLECLSNQYDLFIKRLHNNNLLLKEIDIKEDFILSLQILDLNLVVSIGLLKNHFKVEQNKKNVAAEISSEIFDFLLKNSFGRGSVTINGRIQFNYDYAHRFFLFFFIFYANNIGINFNEFSKLTQDMLHSVANTSVMNSILIFNENARYNLKSDVVYLSRLFEKKSLYEDKL